MRVLLQTIFCHVFHISVLLLVMALFEVAPKYSAEVLSSVPNTRTLKCFMEKISVLERLHSGMSYSAAGCKLIVSKSIIHTK